MSAAKKRKAPDALRKAALSARRNSAAISNAAANVSKLREELVQYTWFMLNPDTKRCSPEHCFLRWTQMAAQLDSAAQSIQAWALDNQNVLDDALEGAADAT